MSMDFSQLVQTKVQGRLVHCGKLDSTGSCCSSDQDEIKTLGHPSNDVIVCDSNDGGTQKVFCKANSDARHMCQLQKLGMKR